MAAMIPSQPESGKRPYFASTISYDFPKIIDASYATAKAEAIRIFNLRGIQTKIELLRPVHLGYSTTGLTMFNIPGTTPQTFTLKSNVALFPWGIMNNDPTWMTLKWYEGNQTKYIGDWYTRPVYFFEEQQGAWGGQLEPYNFRGDQTFTFTALSRTGSTTIQGWILAFVVEPTTLEESAIYVT
jgi:hypothetical protein